MAFIEFMYFNGIKTRYPAGRKCLSLVIEQADAIELIAQCVYGPHKF